MNGRRFSFDPNYLVQNPLDVAAPIGMKHALVKLACVIVWPASAFICLMAAAQARSGADRTGRTSVMARVALFL
jgi:hypothetical protein